MKNPNKILGSIFLVVGVAVGAGMLALPVSNAAYGFIPSILLLIGCWAILTFTALLLLEVNLWLKPDSNIISMAKQTLGLAGEIVAWITYTLLLYSLMAAYLSGMGDIVQSAIQGFFHFNIYSGTGCILLMLIVGWMIYLGTSHVDYLNRFFLAGKFATLIVILLFISPHVETAKLTQQFTFHHMWIALPIVVTSFGFHNIIPSIRVYLDSDVRKIRRAIIIGSTIPLVLYIIWEFVIMGVVPVNGQDGLLSVLGTGQPGTGLAVSLNHILHSTWLTTLFKIFVFFAIGTSFVGVSFSLADFMADGLHIRKTPLGKLATIAITFAPPLIFALVYPRGFIVALGYAGFFVAFLLALLPAFMTISGRYWLKIAQGYRVKGGVIPLIIVILFALAILVVEVTSRL
jgi:tyrosine-specific transport protein